jgi:hypothetical protein
MFKQKEHSCIKRLFQEIRRESKITGVCWETEAFDFGT